MLKVKTGLLILFLFSLSAAKKKFEPGQPFPDLKLTLLDSDSQVSIKNYRGKLTVLDFWASWCLPCAKSMPKMEELQKKYPDIKILGINLDDKATRARDFLKKYKISFENLYDKKKEMAELLDIKGMPAVIVLDKNGIIMHRTDGYSYQEMDKLEKIIQEN